MQSTSAVPPARPLTSARPAAALHGVVAVPGDKSISHRALMFGALAVGETRISGLLTGEDVLRTAAAMRALGAEVTQDEGGAWRVAGRGIGGLTEPSDVLDMGNSGTAARLLCGILASHPLFAVMTGDASLRGRPMRRVIDPLTATGARFSAGRRAAAAGDRGRQRCLAAGLSGAGAVGAGEVGGAAGRAERAGDHPGRGAGGDARPQREHAAPFRATVRWRPGRARIIDLVGQPELRAADVVVPGDPSSAAFPLVAALLVPGSRLTHRRGRAEPAAHRAVAALAEMGAV